MALHWPRLAVATIVDLPVHSPGRLRAPRDRDHNGHVRVFVQSELAAALRIDHAGAVRVLSRLALARLSVPVAAHAVAAAHFVVHDVDRRAVLAVRDRADLAAAVAGVVRAPAPVVALFAADLAFHSDLAHAAAEAAARVVLGASVLPVCALEDEAGCADETSAALAAGDAVALGVQDGPVAPEPPALPRPLAGRLALPALRPEGVGAGLQGHRPTHLRPSHRVLVQRH